MFNLFRSSKKDRLWDFAGGIHPPEMKTQSSTVPLRHVPLAETFVVPLQQHLGPAGELVVQTGDRVLKGTPLTVGQGRSLPVHAPTSGTIIAIEPRPVAHPSGLAELCAIIQPDGEDRWCDRAPVADYRQLEAAELLKRIQLAGIAGLGGAGFPTATKLDTGKQIDTLIINAAECEPYITADDRLMQECADQIVSGILILCHLLTPHRTLIGIEDNKPEAIRALTHAISGVTEVDLQLRVIPTKYPSGGAKQLTRILTGKEVPHGKHSSAIGVLMQNVGTAFAIKRAIIDGEPLIERVITLTGNAITQPGNVWARLGTPVEHLLNVAGYQRQTPQQVIMGGPLMGFTLAQLNVPVVKTSNCLLAPTASEIAPMPEEQACIRCGQCADVCPVQLLPQQLYWFSRGKEHQKAREHNLFDCIECGACAYVCPSHIPLVHYYRQEKAEINALEQQANQAAEAKARYEARLARLARDKQAREERHKKAAVVLPATDQNAVQAALARVRSKRAEAATGSVISITGSEPDNQAAIAARAALKAEIRQRKMAQSSAGSDNQPAQPIVEPTAETASSTEPDARKAAVAAAIARAKAKQSAQLSKAAPAATQPLAPHASAIQSDAEQTHRVSTVNQSATPVVDNTEPDARKAAVAAAIARVKAKQSAQLSKAAPAATQPLAPHASAIQSDAEQTHRVSAVNQSATPVVDNAEPDARKAAVAAAIARVKAKKSAQQIESQSVTPNESEQR
ncbi:electron transport complex subunit RsxC [Serratia microhaemolytica]|uniref:electron transport complex subunit RsxC n=1 Tax=Serratia microhaemolytica TaxID=2675110 RepID=UPI000FDDD11F|nr:electron transport complex subunit RsxC [Serratia microhaemolytica]